MGGGEPAYEGEEETVVRGVLTGGDWELLYWEKFCWLTCSFLARAAELSKDKAADEGDDAEGEDEATDFVEETPGWPPPLPPPPPPVEVNIRLAPEL